MSSNKIVLTSSDGESFEIDEAVARKFQTISNMIEDDCADKPIPVANVTGKILALTIEYCKKHVDDNDSTKDAAAKKDLVTWDEEFMKNFDAETVFSLFLAGKYLNAEALVASAGKDFAGRIKDKTPQEIREIFNIEKDHEEENIREQDIQWVSNPNPSPDPITTMTTKASSRDLEEILCYVPATYLRLLRATCDRWNSLIRTDELFATKHTDKAAKQYLILLLKSYRLRPTIINLSKSLEVKRELSVYDSRPTTDSDQCNIPRAFHCDGWFVNTRKEDESRVVLWNPLTNYCRWLDWKHRLPTFRRFALGYTLGDDNKKRYKVLGYYPTRSAIEIYDLGSHIVRYFLEGETRPKLPVWSLFYNACVSLKGNVYWLGTVPLKKKYPRTASLFKFDFSTEKYSRVPLPLLNFDTETEEYVVMPPESCDGLKCMEIYGLSDVRDERLSIFLTNRTSTFKVKVEIWVTDEIVETTQVVTWSKLFAFDCSGLGFSEFNYGDRVTFSLDEEKKMVTFCLTRFVSGNSKNWIYIVEDGQVTEQNIGIDKVDGCETALYNYKVDGCETALYNYVPSMAKLEFPSRKRKRGADQSVDLRAASAAEE